MHHYHNINENWIALAYEVGEWVSEKKQNEVKKVPNKHTFV